MPAPPGKALSLLAGAGRSPPLSLAEWCRPGGEDVRGEGVATCVAYRATEEGLNLKLDGRLCPPMGTSEGEYCQSGGAPRPCRSTQRAGPGTIRSPARTGRMRRGQRARALPAMIDRTEVIGGVSPKALGMLGCGYNGNWELSLDHRLYFINSYYSRASHRIGTDIVSICPGARRSNRCTKLLSIFGQTKTLANRDGRQQGLLSHTSGSRTLTCRAIGMRIARRLLAACARNRKLRVQERGKAEQAATRALSLA